MGYSNQFFKALGINPDSITDVKNVAKSTGIPVTRLRYYNVGNVVPSGKDLEAIESKLGLTELDLMLKMGRLNHFLVEAIQEEAEKVKSLIKDKFVKKCNEFEIGESRLAFETEFGKMYHGDCIATMRSMESDSVDLIFADPPFNLDKLYPSNMNDNLRVEKYVEWSEGWIKECVRILKPGGAFFSWNLPLWNSKFSSFLHGLLTFRHWIATDIKLSLPIQNKLYPSHYSLLYFINGDKPKTFHADRMSMQTCPKCYGDIKDYGGYKHKMNPAGVNLTDIWTDIPPVRHAKYKNRGANELSIKLLDRIIEMASNEGDVIFDPFGGSGTTYVVSEIKKRKWVGAELGPVDIIKERLERIDEERTYLENYRRSYNNLFPEKIKKEREKRGLWTCESVGK